MRLIEPQSRELLAKHGAYVTEVCDKCGKILGHVRFTSYGEPGAWCSRECRDGVEEAERYREKALHPVSIETARKHVAERGLQPITINFMGPHSRATRKGGRPGRGSTGPTMSASERNAGRDRDRAAQTSQRQKKHLASGSLHVSTKPKIGSGCSIAGERV